MYAPKVSVLIPTYNYAHYLDDTIQSVLKQTYTDFELIIVDNCSTDNTDEVVKKYLNDKRVSFYTNETNVGLVGNWNKCLEYARGKYIKFLCADDMFHPGLLEKFIPVLEQFPDVSIVSSYCEIFGNSNFCRIIPFKGRVSAHVVRETLLGSRNTLGSPSVVMFRKSDAEKVGMFNPQLIKFTDREYYLRLLTLGDCYLIPETFSYVRSHPDTQSSLIQGKKHELIFERHRFNTSVGKLSTPATGPVRFEINETIKRSALRSAAVMYEMLPKLHKKKSRALFKKAFHIGYSEGVLLKPVLHYLQWKYVKRLIGKKQIELHKIVQ